ncbi:UNVERIFIED_ORG: hypothetical protein ABID57_001303 [Arthrobacter sp. UYEF1]
MIIGLVIGAVVGVLTAAAASWVWLAKNFKAWW